MRDGVVTRNKQRLVKRSVTRTKKKICGPKKCKVLWISTRDLLNKWNKTKFLERYVTRNAKLLCILTSEQVLLTPFAGQNHFLDAKTTFYIFFSHTMYKKCKKITKKKHFVRSKVDSLGVNQLLVVNSQMLKTLFLWVHFFHMFYFIFRWKCLKTRKSMEMALKKYFNQLSGVQGHESWLKYTSAKTLCNGHWNILVWLW